MSDAEADRSAWINPGAHPVSEGVYRIPLPLPFDALRAVNVYALVDGDQIVLVDSGWALAESENLLAKSLDEIGFGLRDIRDFLVTHVHRDHYTQAIAIRRVYGNRVALGEGERPALDAVEQAVRTGVPEPTHDLRRAGAQLLIARMGELARAYHTDPGYWEMPDTWLGDGITLSLQKRTLRVIATPGHTQGHVVFHDVAAGALFAGDHVLPHVTPSIGFELPRADRPLHHYLDSLRLMLSLPDATLLPAHGPVAPSVHARVEELLAHHEARLTASAAAVERGADTAFEVAHMLRWTRRERHFDELDLLNQRLATTETMAHLDVLVTRGWLGVTTGEDGVAHYTRG